MGPAHGNVGGSHQAIAQGHGGPQRRGQRRHRPPRLGPLLRLLGLFLGPGGPPGRLGLRQRLLPAVAPGQPQRLVRHDAPEPRRQRLGVAHTMHPAGRPDVRLLDRVLGQLAASQDERRDPQRRATLG